MGNDTGTGGFNLDNKARTFDKVDPGQPGHGSDQEYSSGDVNVDHTPKDIGEDVKDTIGGYLSDLTETQYTQYKLQGPSLFIQIFRIKRTRGKGKNKVILEQWDDHVVFWFNVNDYKFLHYRA